MPHNTFATSGPSLVGHTLDNGRLELLSVLGLGAYGVVYLAVDLHAPTPVYLAVKCLLRTGLDSRQRHFQRREIALHQLASRHPNVVTLHKVIEEGDYVFVIMDFCDEGDLFGMITERQRYIGDDALIKKVFLQIVDAVEYCHSMGIFHRDLKPENILCTKDGSRICIADFGLATSERFSTDFGCGSTFYLSPDCQGGLFERLEKYNTASNDLWSLGVILVNLTCGRNPWRQACPSDETFRAYVHDPNFLRTILPISHATNHILKGLFALEAKDRLTLKDLRRAIMSIDTFTMSEDELRTAHSAARAAAAAYRPIPPAVKALPKVPSQPVHTTKHHATPTKHHAPRHVQIPPTPPTPAIDVDVEPVDVVDIEMDEELHRVHPSDRISTWSRSGSSGSAFAIDADILDTIDFTHKPTHYSPPRRRAPANPLPRLPQLPQLSTLPPQPVMEDFDSQPSPMVPNSSRSSSSGDASLPPTPEFDAADKIDPTMKDSSGSSGSIPEWQLDQRVKKHVPKPDILHVAVEPLGATQGIRIM